MKIVFSGGGTLGPVTPLIEIYDVAKETYPEAGFLWIGTEEGQEKGLIESAGLKFVSVPSAKLRRYFSIKNIIDFFKFFIALYKSLKILIKEKVDLCITAGGFVSVPVHWAAWMIGVPTWVHQQDIQPGLANRLMAPSARIITTALEQSKFYFKNENIKWIGNPVRRSLLDIKPEEGIEFFKLRSDLPVVLVLGGGTGSMRVNEIVVEAVSKLKGACQIIHLSGLERPQEQVRRAQEMYGDYYQVHEFLSEEMGLAYAAADLVVARAGFGSISELAALEKPTILVPKPGHQEANARYLGQKRAVRVVNERKIDGYELAKIIKNLLTNGKTLTKMGQTLQSTVPTASSKRIRRVLNLLLS